MFGVKEKGRKEPCTPLTKNDHRSALRMDSGTGSAQHIHSVSKRSRRAAQRRLRPVPGRKVQSGSRANLPESQPQARHTARPRTLCRRSELLQAGVDRAVIALWLGHESVETTQVYLDADLALNELALSKTAPIGVKQICYRPDDELLAFLKQL